MEKWIGLNVCNPPATKKKKKKGGDWENHAQESGYSFKKEPAMFNFIAVKYVEEG